MDDKEQGLPEKIYPIETLRLMRNATKHCRCENKSFVVDVANSMVNCGSCGARIEPFEAIKYMALHSESLRTETENLLEQRRAILNYKPHMVVFRDLESRYRGKKMLPMCPHCDRGFYFEELKGWINTAVELSIRTKESEENPT